jgi:hypothetical protein
VGISKEKLILFQSTHHSIKAKNNILIEAIYSFNMKNGKKEYKKIYSFK